MWVARNKYGDLNLFEDKPERCDKVGYSGDNLTSITPCTWKIKNPYGGFYSTYGFIKIDNTLFPELKWEDEPIEVEINLTEVKPIKFRLLPETINIIEKETGKSIEELKNTPLNYVDNKR